jgi:hypothetical protein
LRRRRDRFAVPLSMHRSIPLVLFLAVAWLVLPATARAQSVAFGGSDDPREAIQDVWWRHDQQFDVMGGPSLIGRQWRLKGAMAYNLVSPLVLARFSAQVRAGVYGIYEPDVSGWYDAIRTIEFARYNAPPGSRLHARIGVINQMRLGQGHLVDFFNSGVAWDERTIGVEAMLTTPLADVQLFSDNVLFDGIVGGRVALRPFGFATDPRTRSLEAGISAISDIGTLSDDRTNLVGYNLDMTFYALGSDGLHLAPWASFAWYAEHGSGLGFGATIGSPNFIDIARFQLRAGLFYNGDRFIPGYIGSFYSVNNDRARIVRSRPFLEGDREIVPEGTTLSEAVGGNDLVTELRLMIYDRFEFWYHFKRHYGTSNLSEYHFRLFIHTPGQFRVDVGIDRGSLGGFWSMFRNIGDRASLIFGTEYGFTDLLWIHVNARYTYEMAAENEKDGTQYFLVQRRFEPMGGLRLRF